MSNVSNPIFRERCRSDSPAPGDPRPPQRLPATARHLTSALRLSAALTVVSAIAAIVGVFVPVVFRDPAGYAGNARGTYVVVLAVALPAMVTAMRLAARGSTRACFVWLGCLAYLTYNSVIASFSLQFNELFLVYVAGLSLGVWSIVALVSAMEVDDLPARVSPTMPVYSIATYLVVTSIAFGALWLSDVIPATLNGTRPASLRGTTIPVNVIHVLDLAFTLPLAAIGGVWLARRRRWGVLIAGTMLVMLVIEAVSVASDQVFGHLADPAQPLSAVPLFIALTVVGLLPTVAFLRAIQPGRRADAATT